MNHQINTQYLFKREALEVNFLQDLGSGARLPFKGTTALVSVFKGQEEWRGKVVYRRCVKGETARVVSGTERRRGRKI